MTPVQQGILAGFIFGLTAATAYNLTDRVVEWIRVRIGRRG